MLDTIPKTKTVKHSNTPTVKKTVIVHTLPKSKIAKHPKIQTVKTTADIIVQPTYNANEREIMANLAWSWRTDPEAMRLGVRYWALKDGIDNGMPYINGVERHAPSIQQMYADYIVAHSNEKFYELVCSSTMPDHPADLQDCKKNIEYLKVQPGINLNTYNQATSAFKQNMYVLGMYYVMVMAGTGSQFETMRATFRDNRDGFVKLFY